MERDGKKKVQTFSGIVSPRDKDDLAPYQYLREL